MTTRKTFLAAGAALAALGVPLDAPAKDTQAAFEEAVRTNAPHKHLFAATRFAGGDVINAMRNTLSAYRDLGTPLNEVFPVAVLYHGPIVALALDDAMWEKYVIAAAKKYPLKSEVRVDFNSIYDPKLDGNPSLHQHAPHDRSIESLVADADARFLVCDNALRGYSSDIATVLDRAPNEIYGELTTHLVKNATIVPAGVWAIHALQERHFTLLQTMMT
jgi:intracellular sulfur oxidation DsrE/DsrF family protein